MDTQEIERVGSTLFERGLTIAVAEADTAGYVGHLLCSPAGASRYFPGGIIAYASDSKTRVLGVRRETASSHGSVSRQMAVEMAQRARELIGTDIGISTTGIAGPTGGSADRPVGTFWVALSVKDGTELAQEHRWQGDDRMANKERAADASLRLVEQYLGLK
ncbi:MAG: CinA family protein [Dehalococcoidia bacterium]|jgi:nicotinamide-nucleotide amidase|nr:CinA family protein [Dehalococcoidia bacterium]MDP7239995.1 CinA family protein [Dehalococcoidia bacterium]MDP7470140.1 CinA family protein [Dehalococcoidia bacterium]